MGGRRGRLISSETRQAVITLISEARLAGARKHKACDIVNQHAKMIFSALDEARLSPPGRKHINSLGHFSFSLPQVVEEGSLRALNVDEEQEPVW